MNDHERQTESGSENASTIYDDVGFENGSASTIFGVEDCGNESESGALKGWLTDVALESWRQQGEEEEEQQQQQQQELLSELQKK